MKTDAGRALRVGVYARVSTADRDQNPETQLAPLREFAAANGWQVTEYVDHAAAGDLKGRKAWAQLLHDAARRRIDLVLCWKIDRMFRSVSHASTTLERFRGWGVGLRSYSEPWVDTTNAFGEMAFNLLTTFAQFERSLIAERVRAGMARAKAQGIHCGRPRKAPAAAVEAVA
jgi:DNA invertase Pin-like site-specific DNA recombinase